MKKKKGGRQPVIECPVCRRRVVPTRDHQRFCNNPPGRCRKIDYLRRHGILARKIGALEAGIQKLQIKIESLKERLATLKKYAR